MPRIRKPPRLWLRAAQRDERGAITHLPVWYIKDGTHAESTGCGEDDHGGAAQALANYINRKHETETAGKLRDIASIPVADVLALYARVVAPSHARPDETAKRIDTLLDFFEDLTLADINGDLCREYADWRSSPAAARRELEDLRAAINHHRREGKCNEVVEIVLPTRGAARERWLTRSEAARLVLRAWRYRETQKGQNTDRRTRKHVARFLLAAFYTTRRKGAILTASLVPAEGRPWVDLKTGVYYGRRSKRRSKAREKKSQPSIRIPMGLLAHMRRWHRNGQTNVVEFNGEAIGSIDKAFAANAEDAGFGPDVTPHTTRHTGITWLAIEAVDPYEICRYAGITMEIFEDVYAHHHPDFMTGVHRGFARHRSKPSPLRHQNAGMEREQTGTNVIRLAEK